MKKLSLFVALMAFGAPTLQAEVLNSNFKVAAGYWMESGSGSEENNQGDETVIIAEYRAKTDWGSSVVRGLIENIGGTNESPNGMTITTLKTFSTTYVDIGDSPFSVWLDHMTVGNNKIADNHVRAGISYKNKFGPVRFSTQFAPEYYFGHSPFDDAKGMHLFGRTILSYDLTDNIKQAFIFENVNFRNNDIQDGIGWKEHGYHYMLNTSFGVTEAITANLQLHHFESFGGYGTDGNSIFVNFSYNM
ncbi:hypothetical protein [Shewanella youngdeokensis]|uniref:Ion channel protein Tsx n=1 Tax=Shewanella youngdeokensis TaxID=2999068 RepID=A0ABZ0JY61_9GAMM|nr:hypothetical protein RGE70_14145 [Shewanella sp. DAU334]